MTRTTNQRSPIDRASRARLVLSRRELLHGASALSAYAMLGGCGGVDPGPPPGTPGSRPRRDLPEGTDTLPQIEHVVVLMMENHSFDNYFGMLDPSVGFTLQDGAPTASCPDGMGHHIRAFHMPSGCQLDTGPSQAWDASHTAYADGRNDGFVLASGPVAMGYWTEADIPFYCGLARTFTLASRWFGSTLCQTYPNRRFLFAGTAAGIVTTELSSIAAPPPPNGTIFDRLDAHGITWRDYASDLTAIQILPALARRARENVATIEDFLRDAAAGTLPSVSLVDPPFVREGSEENPQDVRIGEQFAAQIVNAVMAGPGWPRTLLVWLYDEHGGYYDHVPPPDAILPDDIPPMLGEGHAPGAYDRYGFRVPAVVISPYAKPGYVSPVVRDHTAILKFIERKWNLGALTFRDATADDLSDCLDFDAPPAFLSPPVLPEPALASPTAMPCTPGMPGEIPPPDAIIPD
jgi:phospholipase C